MTVSAGRAVGADHTSLAQKAAGNDHAEREHKKDAKKPPDFVNVHRSACDTKDPVGPEEPTGSILLAPEGTMQR